MRPILRLAGVTKIFGEGGAAVRALDRIDLEVAPGELVLVTGPSGSGKTTLLQVAGALMTPTAGRIEVDGTLLDRLTGRALARLRAQRIGFVFQAFNLFSNLTAEGNVRLPTRLVPGDRRPAAGRPSVVLRELGLSDRAHHRPGELSGGQQQRVAIARALVNDPPLILADEPTGNLDSRSGYQVLHLLEEMARDRGKTVVVVTHDYRIADVADRVLWLEDGRFGPAPAEADTVADPVCGMAIQADRAAASRSEGGRTYHFCSDICVSKFDRDPRRYLSAAPIPSERAGLDR